MIAVPSPPPGARSPPDVRALLGAFRERRALVGVVGLGYVGVPLALAAAGQGFRVLGFDTDAARAAAVNRGDAVLHHLPAGAVAGAVASGRLAATADLARLGEPDALLIAVPTPLDARRAPDLSHVVASAEAIARALRPGQLVVLESTTYPGTTREVVRPLLEASGLRSGQDFFLAFSPEREDPGNADYGTRAIPKLVGADGPDALALAVALYEGIVERVVPVSSPEVAEAAKLAENVFRAVNIALANELKLALGAMGIDPWEVVAAAATKPFGYMAFHPGPGPGGHCIPVDPHYLSWRARAAGAATPLIDAAGAINDAMPAHVVARTAAALPGGLAGRRVLVLGVAYKRGIADVRESPGLAIMALLEAAGALADHHDALVPVIPALPERPSLAGRRSVPIEGDALACYDAVVIATDHDGIDYARLPDRARLVVDARNAVARAGGDGARVVKA